MNHGFIDLTNQTINNLKFLSYKKYDNGEIKWMCQCYCGKEFVARANHIKRKLIQSCGCLNSKNVTDRNKSNRKWKEGYKNLYSTWLKITYRCLDPNNKSYKRYGGRGISLYEEWKTDFNKFAEWIIENLGEKVSLKFSLDRINNDGNYEPGNLRWATHNQQGRNRRGLKLNEEMANEIRNSKKSLSVLAKKYNCSKSTIARVKNNKGWAVE